MKKFLFYCFFISPIHYSFSQASDFIILKKNEHTIQSFFAGSVIAFETDRGYYSGKIKAIQKDSIYITQYDIRQVPTRLGIYVTDTLAAYNFSFNYKEILNIGSHRKGFNRAGSGASLFGGAILLTTIGLGTWLFTKPGTQYYASPYLVAGSAVLGGIGYLLLKSGADNTKISKKYHLDYIKVK